MFLQTAERLSGRVDGQLRAVWRLMAVVILALVLLIAGLVTVGIVFNLHR